MAKKIKMVLYGEPGTGKSVFAGNSSKAFFITSDGNYEWLEGLVPDFDEKNHVQISSFAEFERLLPQLLTDAYAQYDTFVLDIIDNLYTWADFELCKKNRVNHVSELGDYGKGYDLLRKPFIAAILKFIAIDKNIIILSHESTYEEKTKKGTTITRYTPNSTIPLSKVWEKIAGQCQFVIRCYKDYETDENGRTVIKRLLDIKNTPEEWGTYRLLDSDTPDTIPLDWNVFSDIVGLSNKKSTTIHQTVITSDMKSAGISETKEVVTEDEKKVTPAVKVTPKPVVTQKIEEVKQEPQVEKVVEAPKPVAPTPKVKTVEVQDLPQQEAPQQEAPKSKADKIAELQRKLAEINAKKNNK